MRFFATLATALLATVVAAQNNAISIPEGSSTLSVTAGQPLTIDWTNPSSGTITIKLVQQPVTPDSGVVLASGIPASIGSATLQIPDAADVNSFQYTIEIVDDTNTSNINFSPNFGITGATGTATGSASTASITGSTASSGSNTASSTGTASDSTDSSAATTSGASSSGSTRSAAATSSGSSTSTRASSTTSASAASQTTSAPTGNAAVAMKVQGGVFAVAVGVVVAVL